MISILKLLQLTFKSHVYVLLLFHDQDGAEIQAMAPSSLAALLSNEGSYLCRSP